MPKFKVTVVDRTTTYAEKGFEADDADEARQMAEEDESWSDLDGWDETASYVTDNGIEEFGEEAAHD